MGPRTTHGTDDDNPSEVLLVPPPVRPRRLPHRLPPVSDASAAATWLAEDADAVPTEDGPPARERSPVLPRSPRRLDPMPAAAVPHRFREPSPSPPMRWGETPRPVPLAASENRLDHADASVFESIDDPLTLSSNDTVPLFGLAPTREVQPNPRPRPPVPASARVAWTITAVALLLTLAMALALLLF